MDSLKKFLAVLFAILFVFTAIPALILFNFEQRAFTAETYQKAFANEGFYNELPAVLAETVTSASTDKSQFPLVMQGMNKEAWEAFFRSVLPQESLKTMGDDLLNSTFAYLNMQTNTVQLSLIPLKTNMTSDSGVQAVYDLLSTQADCTLAQIAQMTIGLFSKGEMQFCKPPAELYPLLTPVIQGQMQMTALVIPDQITIVSAPPENDPRAKLQTLRMLMRLSPIAPLAFLLLTTIFAVNSLKTWLNWWGIPFLIIGVIASLMELTGAPIFGAVFQRILVSRMPAFLPSILLNYTSNLASAMIQALLNPILWQGLVIALIGLVMVVSAYFIKGNKKIS